MTKEWHGCSDPDGHTFENGVCVHEDCGFDLRPLRETPKGVELLVKRLENAEGQILSLKEDAFETEQHVKFLHKHIGDLEAFVEEVLKHIQGNCACPEKEHACYCLESLEDRALELAPRESPE